MSILSWLICLSNAWITIAGFGEITNLVKFQPINVKSEPLGSAHLVGIKVSRLANGIILENKESKILLSLDESELLQLAPTTRRTKDMPLSDHYDVVFGLYKMPSGYTIVLAKEARSIDHPTIDGVKCATSFEFIDVPFHSSKQSMNVTAVQQNAMFKIMLSSILRRHHFYYSTGAYNILSTWQKNQQEPHNNDRTSTIEDAFFWNQRAVQPFIASNFTSFITKICSMWSSSFQMTIQGKSLHYLLLARRSKLQQGPRYIKRGSNDHGHVANFVEIEQVLVREDGTANSSFVQVRGSIPIHWSQQDTWKLKPPIHLNGDISRDMHSAERHIRSLCDNYANIEDMKTDGGTPNIFAINLIDKKGSQGRLGQQWMTAMSFDQVSSFNDSLLGLNRSEMTVADYAIQPAVMRYLWLDYHYKVKHEGVSSLRQLHRHLLPALIAARGGFYLSRGDGRRPATVAQQHRLVRTNCVDCLDRTNVVQSLVARWALIQQIISVIGSGTSFSSSSTLILPNKEWEKMFRSVWGDLGDHLSSLYASSNAMKRDVTRMGVRTKRGMLDDAVSFLRRYVANNYWDTAYQRALDLLIYNNAGENGQWNITDLSSAAATTVPMEVENIVNVEDVSAEDSHKDFDIDEINEDDNNDSTSQQWTDLEKLFPLSDSNMQGLLKEKVNEVDELFQDLMNDIKLVSETYIYRQSKREK